MKTDQLLDQLLKEHIASKSIDELRSVVDTLITAMKDFEYLNYYILDDKLRLYDENTGESIFPSDDK